MNLVFIDTETGGLDPEKHSLLSLGAVFTKDNVPIGEKEWLIREYKDCPYRVTSGALDINKINLIEHDKNALDQYDAEDEFVTMLKFYYNTGKVILVGHNITFDVSFLKKNMTSLFGNGFVKSNVSYRTVDTHSIAFVLKEAGVLNVESTSLQSLIDHFQIAVNGQRHSALTDARATFGVYYELMKLIKETR